MFWTNDDKFALDATQNGGYSSSWERLIKTTQEETKRAIVC
jgi:hypothetical protein